MERDVVTSLSPRLLPWPDVSDEDWPTLIVGNGMSINVWQGFSYDRLYDEAGLDATTCRVFDELGTSNFERVLEALSHAEIVLDALGRSATSVSSHRQGSSRRTLRYGARYPRSLAGRAGLNASSDRERNGSS
jgi:uncharacterized protein DUF4917